MGKKVLIVDDSLVTRMMIKEIILSEFPEWECIQAASAEKAIEACGLTQFDYITLDINMPGKTGLEVAPHLLQSQPDVKVAVLTIHEHHEVREKVEALGLTFLNKPINADEIIDFVKS
ncbi:response regulator transcription factor [Aliikangiella sp. IMCC44653]